MQRNIQVTPLFEKICLAAIQNDTVTLDALIADGICIHQKCNGVSPVMALMMMNEIDAVQLLLDVYHASPFETLWQFFSLHPEAQVADEESDEEVMLAEEHRNVQLVALSDLWFCQFKHNIINLCEQGNWLAYTECVDQFNLPAAFNHAEHTILKSAVSGFDETVNTILASARQNYQVAQNKLTQHLNTLAQTNFSSIYSIYNSEDYGIYEYLAILAEELTEPSQNYQELLDFAANGYAFAGNVLAVKKILAQGAHPNAACTGYLWGMHLPQVSAMIISQQISLQQVQQLIKEFADSLVHVILDEAVIQRCILLPILTEVALHKLYYQPEVNEFSFSVEEMDFIRWQQKQERDPLLAQALNIATLQYDYQLNFRQARYLHRCLAEISDEPSKNIDSVLFEKFIQQFLLACNETDCKVLYRALNRILHAADLDTIAELTEIKHIQKQFSQQQYSVDVDTEETYNQNVQMTIEDQEKLEAEVQKAVAEHDKLEANVQKAVDDYEARRVMWYQIKNYSSFAKNSSGHAASLFYLQPQKPTAVNNTHENKPKLN